MRGSKFYVWNQIFVWILKIMFLTNFNSWYVIFCDVCIRHLYCVYFTKLFCDTHLWSVLCSMMTWILAHWQWWCRRRQVNRACCLQCVGALNSQACCPMLFPYPLRESDFVKEDRSVEQEHSQSAQLTSSLTLTEMFITMTLLKDLNADGGWKIT